jgi:hypothetical protein
VGFVRLAVVVLPLLVGCGFFGGRAGQPSRGEQLPPDPPAHLDVTLISHCARPVTVCYGGEKCLTLSDAARHVVHAATTGDTVFVRLDGSSSHTEADVTFSMIEVDASCAHLERRLAPR